MGKDIQTSLMAGLGEVNRLQSEAEQQARRLISGEVLRVSELLSAVDKAGIAFDLLMRIRGQLTDAYREIQQMQR